MLLMSLLALTLTGWCVAAPVGREVYRMPQNALKALSDRGTVVMEAVMARALFAVDAATAERGKAESNCRGCMPCLFQDCGQRTAACATAESVLVEPSCDVIRHAQSVTDEAGRSWALSQVCGFYQHRCSTPDLQSDSCIRIMGESCSSRLLECSLINTMQSLEPALESRTQAICGQQVSVKGNYTQQRSRIMGGSPAPPGSWPWLVNLQLNGALMCGGVLVDSSWVLTAAHCFTGSHSDSDWTAVVGEFDITQADPDEQVMKVNRIITHPKFNPKTFNNDIALIELSSPVVYSEQVIPVCLPPTLEPPTGTPCLVAGWGSLYEDGPSADVVMEAKVPLLSQGTCKSALGKQLLTNTMFCAGYLSGGIDSCQGDSGGPLIFQDHSSGRFHLYGITSWGDGCGVKDKPGVYTRVMAYSDWILSEIHKSLGRREPTCSELLKTSELSEEQRISEFDSVCRFYVRSCPSTLDPTACQRLAQDTCQSHFKKCQLHSFLQTLLDVLQRADYYIRDKVDLTFFAQSLPQLVEHVYSSVVTTRTRRHAADAEQVNPSSTPTSWKLPPVFEQVGPLVEDWENYLNSIAEHLEQSIEHDQPKLHPAEEKLFQQDGSALHQLDGELCSTITLLRSRLASRHLPALSELEGHLFEMDFINPYRESETPGGTAERMLDPRRKESMLSIDDWFTLVLQALTKRDQEVKKSETKTLSRTQNPASSAVELTTQSQKFVTKDKVVGHETPSWTPYIQKRSPVLPLLLQVSSNMKTNVHPQRRRRRHLLERHIHGASNKVCPGVAESAQQVIITKEMYSWILDIRPSNLNMNFQEVLLDLTTKNEHSLYKARIKATVGGRLLTFHSLVGLENEPFYRSMPRVIAVALDALKT